MITRVIVCGSRDFCDQEYCFSVLDSVFSSLSEIELISGHAKGADQMAEAYAKAKGIPVKTFLPDWKRYGKGAGPFRNREMLDYAKEAQPLVIAFWDGKSRGTKNMIDIAQKEGVKAEVYYP